MSAGPSPCAGCGQETPPCWVCRPSLAEVIKEHQYDYEFGCPCPENVGVSDWPAHLADVVLAWVTARLDGLRDDVWEWLPYSKIPEASDADAVLDIIRGALGVPQEATGAAVSDEERSVGFGDGSDDEGGL